MENNEVFTFKAPNGADVVAVVLDKVSKTTDYIPDSKCTVTKYLCYGQNRLFYYTECTYITRTINNAGWEAGYGDCVCPWEVPEKYRDETEDSCTRCDIIVEYCILPEYDDILMNY